MTEPLSSSPASQPSSAAVLSSDARMFMKDSGMKIDSPQTKENIPPSQLHSAVEESVETTTRSRVDASVSAVAGRAAQATARRKAVANWVENLLGDILPIDTDAEFRAALRDGVLLCSLLNTVRPGTISKIAEVSHTSISGTSERIRSMENVTNFLKAVRALGLPETATFNLGDLESKGLEDRPRVAECLLALKRMHEARDLKTVTLGPWASPGSLRGAVHSPVARTYGGTDGVFGGQQLHFSPMPAESPEVLSMDMARSLVATSGPAGGSEGVINLMHQCTNMLKQRMLLSTPRSAAGGAGSPATSRAGRGDMSIDTVGPVLETVLGNLTQEYEKRLLIKDQEVKLAVDGQRKLQGEVAVLHHELQLTRSQLDEVKRLTGPELDDKERAELEELRVKEEAMHQQMEELSVKMQMTAEAAREKEEMAAGLQAECQQLQAAVDDFADFNERYRAMSEENKRLYNEVQDLKGNIRVFCRIRPLGTTGDMCDGCVDLGGDGELAVYNPKHRQWKTFKFDKVFGPTSTQDEVYEDTKPLIRSVLDGYNVCIFAYGQTGSGKTHTMSGTNVQEYSGRGINYRALDDLFELNRSRAGEVQYRIHVQLLEIYNEQLRDLLVDGGDKNRKLELRTTEKSGNNVPDATQVEVTCAGDVLHVMEVGQRNRASAETRMNERSSRSHSVLTITVDGDNMVTGVQSHGCLHLIDLAGSERVVKSGADGDRLEEAKHINKSLSALGDVMAALAAKSAHVPYRNSKLTQLLQDSLSGQAKAMMFVHVAPEETSHGESVSTLAFGARVSDITLGQAKKNVETAALIRSKEQLSKLEQQAQQDRMQAMRLREELEERNRVLEQAAAEKAAMQRKMAELEAKLGRTSTSSAQEHTPPASLRFSSSHAPASAPPGRYSSSGSSRSCATDAIRVSQARKVCLDLSRLGKEALTPRGTSKFAQQAANASPNLPWGCTTPRSAAAPCSSNSARDSGSVCNTPRSRSSTLATPGRASNIPRPPVSCATPRSARSSASHAPCASGGKAPSQPASSGAAQCAPMANSRLPAASALTRTFSGRAAQPAAHSRPTSRTSGIGASSMRSSQSIPATSLRSSASLDSKGDRGAALVRNSMDSRAMRRSMSECGGARGGWK